VREYDIAIAVTVAWPLTILRAETPEEAAEIAAGRYDAAALAADIGKRFGVAVTGATLTVTTTDRPLAPHDEEGTGTWV
jgi:hypothetical protein